ncbi:MAG: thioesterase [Alphaproteobacteria bacterium]|nr:thioesterase [Alphaproteobacteria bacterium]
MNLYLRLLRVVIAALFRGRVSPLEETRVSFRVWPLDLDTNLHLTNARYFSFMDLSRVSMIVRSGLVPVLFRKRWFPVLAGAAIKYRRPVAPFRRFDVTNRILGWDDRWIHVEQRLETPGHVNALAVLRIAFLGPKGARVAPRELLAAAGHPDAVSPPLPDHVRIWN